MSLGQCVTESTIQFLVAHSFFIVVGLFFGVLLLDFYNRYLRINKNTDNIDLMALYLERQMRNKYGPKR